MIKFRTKEQILAMYRHRYPALDEYAAYNLGKEYEHYFDLVKDLRTKEDVVAVFEDCIKRNEERYSQNDTIGGTEGNLHGKYMDILANYGIIVFFRDHILAE